MGLLPPPSTIVATQVGNNRWYISWSAVSGAVSYSLGYNRYANYTWSGWSPIGTIIDTYTESSVNITGATNKIKFRIQSVNSDNYVGGFKETPEYIIMTFQRYANIAGAQRRINNFYCNVNGAQRSMGALYVNINGVSKQF